MMDDVSKFVMPNSKGEEDNMCVSVVVKYMVSKVLKNTIMFVGS
jgi:hypothetical protein